MFFQKIKYFFYYIRPLAFLGIFIVFILHSSIAAKFLGFKLFDVFSLTKILPALSIALLAVSANALNNVFDLKIDKINKPERVLASGRISLQEAWLISVSLYFISFIFSFWSGVLFFIFYIILFLLTVFYSIPPFRFKNHWMSAGTTLALARGLLLVLSAWSIWGKGFNLLSFWIGLVFFVLVFAASIAKDISDIEGDKQQRVKTIAVVYGLGVSRALIIFLSFLSFVIIFSGFVLNIFDKEILFLFILLPYLFYITYLLYGADDKLSKIDNNHMSWKHIYILYMLLHFFFAFIYLF